MPFSDYYKTLGINQKATSSEIKKAFRLFAKKFHPDKNFGSETAQEKFIQVHEAYEVLNDLKRREAYDYSYSSYYNSGQKTTQAAEPKQAKEKEIFKPSDLRDRVIKMRSYVRQTSFSELNRAGLYSYLLELLSSDNVNWLLYNKIPEINASIIENILYVVRTIPFENSKILHERLIDLADKNEAIVLSITSAFKKGRIISLFFVNRAAIIIAGVILFFVCTANWSHIFKSSEKPSDISYYHPASTLPSNPGVFQKDSVTVKKDEDPKISFDRYFDEYSTWKAGEYISGNTPSCFKFTPKYDYSLDNELEIKVGNNTNVAIKLINSHSNKCIRYIYIAAGEKYSIRNIPQGKYYLKIAYGKEWKETYLAGKCRAKFTVNPLYKRGKEILDYNKISTGTKIEDGKEYNTYELPSFQLSLDVITTNETDKFQTDEIEENDFDN